MLPAYLLKEHTTSAPIVAVKVTCFTSDVLSFQNHTHRKNTLFGKTKDEVRVTEKMYHIIPKK